MEVHYSSKTVIWETPQEFFERYNRIYRFETDVCALPENAKCETYFTPEQDGLSQKWEGSCWMNPPYGREISAWMKKAYESALNGATVVCLIPSRTDTKWWHDYAMKGEVEFIRGRLKFGGCKDNAPFPNAVVVFKGELTIENAPIGTQAPSIHGGYWHKTECGWKWCTGSTFPRPGGDWNGNLVLPKLDIRQPASNEAKPDDQKAVDPASSFESIERLEFAERDDA